VGGGAPAGAYIHHAGLLGWAVPYGPCFLMGRAAHQAVTGRN
jgi:hypothetical protein